MLGRLGAPSCRHRCLQCGAYCQQLKRTAVWGLRSDDIQWVMACPKCESRIRQQNQETAKRSVDERIARERVSIEYFGAMDRPSSREYLEACERMRREEGW